ncbi:MAG: TolC family protein [Candidatus Omnitrophica bacterium]|nr:TolC family protein [Candidatus Omnitrophota bacterium]
MLLRTLLISFFIIHFSAAFGIAQPEETMEWYDCVIEAKNQHPNLMSAMEQVNQSKASKEVTRSVIMPQIAGSAARTTSQSASGGGTGTSMVSHSSTGAKPKTSYKYGITGEQLLFDGFKTSFDLSAAERNILSSRYNYDVTSSNIRLSLRSAFANLLKAQELVKVTKEIAARRKQNLRLVELRYEGGREHRGSLMTAEADVAQATYDVDQAGRSVYYSQRQLTKEMGRSTFIPMSANGSLEVQDKVELRPDFEELARTTPLLQQLIEKRESAKFGLKSTYADFAPKVYLSGGLDNTNTQWPPDKNEWTVGGSISLPLFDGGNRVAAVSKAKAVLGQALDDERSGRDGVILTLANTWTNLQNAIENVWVRKKYLDATEERAKIARAEYSIGLMSFDNWIIIEDNLVSAKKSYVESEAASLIAEANWIQAKGGTLDYDQN